MKKSLPLIICCIFVSICAESKTGLFNPTQPVSGIEEIRSNLYVKQNTGAPVLLDGDLTEYDASFSNDLNGMDARKMNNFSENLGMARGNYVLVVERRQTINLTDTIFYKMWQLQQRPYQLEFITTNLNHPGLEGYLEDSYLNTSTPIDLNGKTTADFTINTDPASKAANRFRIVFKTANAALTFTSLNAYKQNKMITIDWKTKNEINMNLYRIEKSIDGNRFSGIKNIKANNFAFNHYNWIDKNPAEGNNYYRILSTQKDGKEKYSDVLKVFNANENAEINLYPNPVINNILHVEIANQPQGLYEIRLINTFGQLVWVKRIQHSGGDILQKIQPNQDIKKGVYQLDIIAPGNNTITKQVIY